MKRPLFTLSVWVLRYTLGKIKIMGYSRFKGMSLLVAVSILTSCSANGTEQKKVKIDVHQTDDAIRAELLRYTPIGVDAAKVLEFVHLRLYCEEGFASGIGLVSKPGISVKIGHEFVTVFVHKAVDATWQFDEHRKLQDITIRRYNQEGIYNHANDPPSTPKVRIDLNLSDEAISQRLRKYTPLGSSLGDVMSFIQIRLYCESGFANGLPLTGQPGIGVVLGEYVDARDSSRQVVLVNWHFPDGQPHPKLEGIEVRRSSSFNYYNR